MSKQTVADERDYAARASRHAGGSTVAERRARWDKFRLKQLDEMQAFARADRVSLLVLQERIERLGRM